MDDNRSLCTLLVNSGNLKTSCRNLAGISGFIIANKIVDLTVNSDGSYSLSSTHIIIFTHIENTGDSRIPQYKAVIVDIADDNRSGSSYIAIQIHNDGCSGGGRNDVLNRITLDHSGSTVFCKGRITVGVAVPCECGGNIHGDAGFRCLQIFCQHNWFCVVLGIGAAVDAGVVVCNDPIAVQLCPAALQFHIVLGHGEGTVGYGHATLNNTPAGEQITVQNGFSRNSNGITGIQTTDVIQIGIRSGGRNIAGVFVVHLISDFCGVLMCYHKCSGVGDGNSVGCFTVLGDLSTLVVISNTVFCDRSGDVIIIGSECGSAKVTDHRFCCGRCPQICAARFPVDLQGRNCVLCNGLGEFSGLFDRIIGCSVVQICVLVQLYIGMNTGAHTCAASQLNGIGVFDGRIGNVSRLFGVPVQGVNTAVKGKIAAYGRFGLCGGTGLQIHIVTHGVYDHSGQFVGDMVKNRFQFIGVGSTAVSTAVCDHRTEVGVVVVKANGVDNTVVITEIIECGIGCTVIVVRCSTVGNDNQDLLGGGIIAEAGGVTFFTQGKTDTIHHICIAVRGSFIKICVVSCGTGSIETNTSNSCAGRERLDHFCNNLFCHFKTIGGEWNLFTFFVNVGATFDSRKMRLPICAAAVTGVYVGV